MKARILNVFGVIALASFVFCGAGGTEKEELKAVIVINEPPVVVAAVEAKAVPTFIAVSIEEDAEPAAEVIEEVQLYDTKLDADIQKEIIALCGDDFDAAIVIAMIERESRCNSQAIGDHGNSKGLMQIQERWHSDRMKKLGCDDLLDPIQNVAVGIDYLKELSSKGKSIEWVLMAYNGGSKYANNRTEPSKYAVEVLKRADELKGAGNGN